MKSVILRFTDDEGKVVKSFVQRPLKTGMVDKIMDIAERGAAIESSEREVTIADAKEFNDELTSMIMRLYRGHFTLDEFKEFVDQDEMMRVFQEICANMNGEMGKN